MRLDERGRDVGVPHFARDRVQELVAQQIVEHGIGVAQQPLQRAGEAGELGDASGGEKSDDVQSDVREEVLDAGCARRLVGAPRGVPALAKSGAR